MAARKSKLHLGDGKVVRGKDGWLFLDNDSNFVMRQFAGELPFSEEQLRGWRQVLKARAAWLQKRGVPYRMLVAPEAHAVFPEKLPDGSGDGGRRPVLQLLEYLEAGGSDASFIYPIEALRREKHRCIYAKTETHWTELGAFIAYRELMKEIASDLEVPIPTLGEDDMHASEWEWTGDLGAKVTPVQSSTIVLLDVRKPAATFEFDNRIFNRGRRIEYRCGTAPDVTCLVFGDSFAHLLLPYLAEGFRRLVFAHLPTLDHALVEEEEPDLVVSIVSERFLARVPDDVGAPTLEQVAEEKRAAGQVLADRPWEGNRVESTAPD
jgi:hypothetical protein